MTELSDASDAVSCSMGVDSGNNSEFGSRLSLSAANDMTRVQRCQRKIAELDKEAERARQYNRNLMAEFAEQLKVRTTFFSMYRGCISGRQLNWTTALFWPKWTTAIWTRFL